MLQGRQRAQQVAALCWRLRQAGASQQQRLERQQPRYPWKHHRRQAQLVELQGSELRTQRVAAAALPTLLLLYGAMVEQKSMHNE